MKSRTRKSSIIEKKFKNNSFNLLESYLKPSNVYPNSDTIASSHDNINTDKQNIDIITASNNINNLTINKHTINQNRNTNSKNTFSLITNNELVDNNITQPVAAPNPNQLTFNLNLTITHNLYYLIMKTNQYQIKTVNKIPLT